MKRTNTAKWIESAHRWQINVQNDGIRKTFTSATPGRTGQREANRKADEWLENGIATTRRTVADAWQPFFERTQKTTSESNWRPMQGRYNKWIAPEIGYRKLNTLTQQDVQNIIDNAHSAGKSRKTQQNILGDLRKFFKFCRKSNWTTFIPDEVTVPDSARLKGKTILQPSAVTKLMQCDTTEWRGKTIPDDRIHYYRLVVFTGMRPGELLGLEWADIKNGIAHIKRSRNYYGKDTLGKNQNANRKVVLPQIAIEELKAQKKLTGKQSRVFVQENERNIWRAWKRYCVANDIPPCSLYELRHTFVSIAQDLPTGQLKQIVGHSANMDTYGIYAHHLDGQNAAIAENLNSIFSKIAVE